MDTLSVQNSPVTESSNELTVRLGSSTTEMEILRALRGSDLQIFSGWHEHIGLLDAETIEKIENGAHLLHKVLSSKKGRVIISGCGTSGRIACMTCTYVNRMLKENGQRECCEFLCSGGETSLVISNEFHEDDPHIGVKIYRVKWNMKMVQLFILVLRVDFLLLTLRARLIGFFAKNRVSKRMAEIQMITSISS